MWDDTEGRRLRYGDEGGREDEDGGGEWCRCRVMVMREAMHEFGL